eukprot:1193439-Prorocentrum_minimum.AAC.1
MAEGCSLPLAPRPLAACWCWCLYSPPPAVPLRTPSLEALLPGAALCLLPCDPTDRLSPQFL